LLQQQQNWNAEDSRNLQQEIDFFSSSSIANDGSNPIAKTIDSSIFFHLHPEVEELVWSSDNEHINEHQKELLSDSPDDARPAKVENTNQDSSEKTAFKSAAQNQPQHHQPVQRNIVLQSVKLFAIGIDISSVKSIASGVHCSPDG
jgi:hypothetical protein